MPIVISEFEIVPETEPAPVAAARQADPPARRLTPYEIALALRHELGREARVRAD
jgi:hypothetical protein